jgi:hypothetical protein
LPSHVINSEIQPARQSEWYGLELGDLPTPVLDLQRVGLRLEVEMNTRTPISSSADDKALAIRLEICAQSSKSSSIEKSRSIREFAPALRGSPGSQQHLRRGQHSGRRSCPFRVSAQPLESDRQELAEVKVLRGVHDFYADNSLAITHIQDDIIRRAAIENILCAWIEAQVQQVRMFVVFDPHLSSPIRHRKHTPSRQL